MANETILVIDSDTDSARQMVKVLEDEEYLVFTAPNGAMGINMAKKVNPAIIFLDPSMGGVTGLEVCREIHGTEQLRRVPIVVLSAFEGAGDPRYASLYGIVGSFRKPFTDQELISMTRKTLAGRAEKGGSSLEEEGFGEEAEMAAAQEPSMSATGDKGGEEMVSSFELPEEDAASIGGEESGKEKKEEAGSYGNFPEGAEDGSEGQEAAFTSKRKSWRRRERSVSMSYLVGLSVVIVLVAAAGIFYFDTITSWIGGKTPERVSVRTVPQKKVESTQSADEQAPQQANKREDAGLGAVPAIPEDKAAQEASVPKGKEVSKSDKPGESKPAQNVSQPKEVSKPEAASGHGPAYSVQLGAFRGQGNAELLAKQYKDKGYDAFVLRAGKDRDSFYRVLIGRFEHRKDAAAMARNLGAKENIRAIIFREL